MIYIYNTYTFVFCLGKNPPESSCFIARPATGECREATSERSGAHQHWGIDPFCMIVTIVNILIYSNSFIISCYDNYDSFYILE